MNRILNVSLVCFFMILTFALSGKESYVLNEVFSDDEIKMQIESLSEEIEFQYTPEVKKIINSYLTSSRKSTEIIISRSQYYFPIIEDIMITNGIYIPEEIKHLAVVESGLNPIIKSKAGAVGMWQFMRGTAKMYGLNVSSHYDERKDVFKSTEAAIIYLNDLYITFGDWALAMAAYNCGPGNVKKAIRRGKSANYWKLKKYLPKETSRYLPKFVAFNYILEYKDDIGLSQHESFSEHSSFGSIMVYQKTYLKEISKGCGLSVPEIIKYNPSYHRGVIPSIEGGNMLVLPETYMLTYLMNRNQLHMLKNVYYLKNTLVTFPDINVIQPKVDEEIEDAEDIVLHEDNTFSRSYLNHSNLCSASIDKVQCNSQPTEIVTKRPSSPIAFSRKIKLKKRQTIKDLFGNRMNEIVEMNDDINTTGIIVVK